MSATNRAQQSRFKWVALGLALAVLATGCGGDDDPYGRLTDLELSYVIPNSAQWAGGDPCAESDCSGEIDSSQLRNASWFVVDGIDATAAAVGAEETIQIRLDVAGVVREPEQPGTIDGVAWGQDVAWALEALDAGHELWAATECPGLETGYVCHFVAIDDHDRFAGIGYGQGLLFTTPLARETAHRGSLSGRQFLEDHI